MMKRAELYYKRSSPADKRSGPADKRSSPVDERIVFFDGRTPHVSSLSLYVTCGVQPRTLLLFHFMRRAGYNQQSFSEGAYG